MKIFNETNFKYNFTFWHKIADLFLAPDDLEVYLFYRDKNDHEYDKFEAFQYEGEHCIDIPFEKNRKSKDYKDLKEYIFFHELRHELQETRPCVSRLVYTGDRSNLVNKLGKYYSGTKPERESKVYSKYNLAMPEEVDAYTFASMIMFLKPMLMKMTKRDMRKILKI